MAEPIVNTLGIVGMKHCGAYDSSTNYEKLNVVTYQGSSYCAKGNTVGNLPTNTTYWDLLAEKGATGDTGDTGPQGPKPVKGVDYYTAEDIAELESTLSDDVTSEVSDQLSDLTSAAPLAVSSVADMTDTTRIYVLTTDGHWYWYNGSTWVDGGIYQGTSVSDSDPLIAEMIDDISASTDKTKTKYTISSGTGNTQLTTNGYVEHSTGAVITTGTFKVSDLLPCTDKDTIYLHLLGHQIADAVAFYDKYKNYISGINYSGGTTTGNLYQYVTVPENTKYCRFSMLASDSAGYINHIFRENSLTPVIDNMTFKEIPYNYTKLGQIKNFVGYIDLNGKETSTDVWGTTDFIKLNKTDKISYNIRNNKNIAAISYYDSNHQFISSIHVDTTTLSDATGTVETVPDNVMYCRISYLIGTSSQFFTVYQNTIEDNAFTLDYLFNKSYKNVLFQKKLACTGDSINTTTDNRPYAGFGKMIATKYNMKYTSKSIWGGTLATNVSGSSGAIVSTIETMASDADYILLSGGTNDLTYIAQGTESNGTITTGYTGPFNTDTLCGALESICYQAINKWPGKKILFVITQKNLNNGTSYLSSYETSTQLMIQILEKWGIPYVDLYHNMPSLSLTALKDLYTTNGNTEYSGIGDGLHPNEDGYKIYYLPPIENKLLNI